MRTWQGDKSFAENAKQEPEITALLSPDEIDALCSLDVHFRHVDETTPEEASGPVLFLCSPLANYMHGQVLNVTGGMFGGMYT